MKIKTTSIPEVLIISPNVFEDSRGFFMETFQQEKFKQAGIDLNFVQDNHSRSIQGTLRGLHYQIQHAQGKIVRVVSGEIFDVAVDLRRSSPTFGKWEGLILSAENKDQLFLPPGFAHGFYTLSDWAEVLYKASDFYSPESERSILWDDPTIAIDWPLISGKPPILSKKDLEGKYIIDAEVYP